MNSRIALYFQDKHEIAYELEMAKYAESRGIKEIWQADTRLARDCVVMMSALLTETNNVRIGSGVLPIWTRNPAVIAATWSTMWELAGLDDANQSRVMLGLGAWWEPITSRVGEERKKPLKYIREAVELVSVGAKKSGKSLDQIDRPELLVCSLSDEDPKEAVRTGKSLIAYYLGTEPHIMKASGADPDLVERVKEVVGWPATEDDYRKAADLIPDDLVKSLMAAGTSQQCRETVEEYVDAGVTCPILYPLMDDMRPVIDAFADWSM